ncbi:MAG: HAMP domain-containing histidine kinase, partial [Gemmatimonadaceae bacterium]|nr:HAMP domain-containing histidine kinase [Gemmatimonadaceae bacterium]
MSRTLRGRIVTAFAAFAVVMAAVFGLTTTIFLYSAEDIFFNAMLAEEATLLIAGARAQGAWPSPRHAWMTVHAGLGTVPEDLRDQLRESPTQREFRGSNGRHYHVRLLRDAVAAGARDPTWLVGEVSDRLVIRPMRRELLTQWGIVVSFLLGLSLLLARAIARRIAQPLSALAASVRAVDPGAAPMAALPIEGDREVTVVATALDDLRSRVAAFVERERSFTRDASHELRTPLTVIRSSTEQALRDPLLPPTIQPLLARSHRATERLEWTVSSLLALAREEVVPATDATTPVLPLLEELIVEAATALDTARLTTRVEVPSTCVLPASEPVLRIVLANVLGNACTHGAPGPLVIRAVD